MDNQLKEILSGLLKNSRVNQIINKLNLTKEQVYSAIPILIDIANEKDDDQTMWLTTLYVDKLGTIKRSFIPSTKGKSLEYISKIVTQDISPLIFDEKEKFHSDPERKEIANEFSSFLKKFKDGKQAKGFFIHGEMGVGKTFLVKRFVWHIAKNGIEVGFVNVSKLINIIKASFSSYHSSDSLLLKLINVPILFLDDIGAEKISAWFRDDILFSILNERMENKKPTFFTSNYTIDKLQKIESRTENSKYLDIDKSKRLASRISALSKEINLKGKNKRV